MTAEERALAARLIFHWQPGDPPKDVEWTLRLVAAMFREHAEDAVGTDREARRQQMNAQGEPCVGCGRCGKRSRITTA